jgi:glycosyltransferase involved in cell wall biosynthesis
LGGIYRHVLDLMQGQIERGHDVGFVTDEAMYDEFASMKMGELKNHLKLGLHLVPMKRSIGLGDVQTTRNMRQLIHTLNPDVVHGHGAKGGAYARMAGKQFLRVYTPHGGSLHYSPKSIEGAIYFALEWSFLKLTDLLLFESEYAAKKYQENISTSGIGLRKVFNGLKEKEFTRSKLNENAAEFLFIGEWRHLKGLDVLLNALKLVSEKLDAHPKLIMVGSGPDELRFKALCTQLDLDSQVQWVGRLPAEEAFKMGDILVIPSRAESMPYIVLEAIAAQKSLITTSVGGIPEIYGKRRHELIPPDDADALCNAMLVALAQGRDQRTKAAKENAERLHEVFSSDNMVDGILEAYGSAWISKRK